MRFWPKRTPWGERNGYVFPCPPASSYPLEEIMASAGPAMDAAPRFVGGPTRSLAIDAALREARLLQEHVMFDLPARSVGRVVLRTAQSLRRRLTDLGVEEVCPPRSDEQHVEDADG